MLGFIKRKAVFVTKLFQYLFQQASARGARSTALHSLQWILGMLLSGICASAWIGAPIWALTVLVVAFVAILGLTAFAYIFLLMKDRDALRSENFSLSKLAIERGLIGDSVTGLRERSPLEGKVIEGTKIDDQGEIE